MGTLGAWIEVDKALFCKSHVFGGIRGPTDNSFLQSGGMSDTHTSSRTELDGVKDLLSVLGNIDDNGSLGGDRGVIGAYIEAAKSRP